jgi:hypothetical protein
MKVAGSAEILDYAGRLGWRRALLRGAYVAANQVVRLSIFECFRLRPEDINMELAKAVGNYECRFLAPQEASRFFCQLDGELARGFHEAIARGDKAYVILDGERLASVGLYAEGPTPILSDLTVHFEPPSLYMYRGYTQAAYRGQRLHALGILRAALELFDLQVPQLVTLSEKTNYPATISVHRMGWQRCGAVYRVGIGPLMRLGQTASARANGMRLELRSPKI